MKTTDPFTHALKEAVVLAIEERKLSLVQENIVLDIKEAAAYLKVSVSTLRNQIKEGDVPHYWISGQIRFLKADLTQWLKSNRKR